MLTVYIWNRESVSIEVRDSDHRLLQGCTEAREARVVFAALIFSVKVAIDKADVFCGDRFIRL